MGIIKSLFGRGRGDSEEESSFEYQGFKIQLTPKQGNNGWSTEAIISKEVGGELKTHHFIRADTTGSKEGAMELITIKTRTLIDQSGERIFR
ncbi:MAG: HlyU family transcriptional regulator [Gammaproteobacteria bacterium]|nr:HlyU family transcriptional regulator [Gammaproteobacteria bacterium]